MDFSPSSEQEMLRASVREFAEREIRPIAAHVDRTGEFPHATVAKMASLGLFGMMVPTEYEGAGLDAVSYVVALDATGKVLYTGFGADQDIAGAFAAAAR